MMFYIYLTIGIIVSSFVLFFILVSINCIWKDVTGGFINQNNSDSDKDNPFVDLMGEVPSENDQPIIVIQKRIKQQVKHTRVIDSENERSVEL